MKARHWWTVVGTVIVIVCGFIGQGLVQIACLSILLAMYTAEYISVSIKYERHITEHPLSKDYMRGVQEGMRMGYAQRMMEEKGKEDDN